MPTMPAVAPAKLAPYSRGRHPPNPAARIARSASPTRRMIPMTRPTASSAVGGMIESGTIVSHTPWRAHAAASKLSYPFSVAAMIRSRGQRARNASSTRSAMHAISPSASLASSRTRAAGHTPSSCGGTTGRLNSFR
jgi:hypothetical protein